MADPASLSSPGPWNDVATGYAEEVLPLFEAYARAALRLAALPAGAAVLDVASGPGTLALLAAPTANRVVAYDFADKMLETLDARARVSGLSNVEVVQGDGQLLPFADETFDGVFSMFGLIFYPDRDAGLREMLRVLRPGGRAVVSSWPPREQMPFLIAFYKALDDRLEDAPFANGRGPLSDPDELRREMESAGFRDVYVEQVTNVVHIPSIERFWDAITRSSAPLVQLKKNVPPSQWVELEAGVVEAMHEAFGESPVELHWPALLGVGGRGDRRELVSFDADYFTRRPSTSDPVTNFREIYRTNHWSGRSSVSGPGSDGVQTRALAAALPGLLSDLRIGRLLDLPCGDFAWMQHVDLGEAEYMGADLLPELIDRNQESFAGPLRRFLVCSLISDPLPEADLMLCRDCLVHFSFEDALRALRNVSAGPIRYLLTTTFPRTRQNVDVVTGDWRPINLEMPPFNLPPPERILNEECTEAGGAFADKSLGLWEVSVLRRVLGVG